jgi:uncharacterized protein
MMTGFKKTGLLSFFLFVFCSICYFNIDTITEKIVFQPKYTYPAEKPLPLFHIRQSDTTLKTNDNHKIHVIQYFAKNPKGTIMYCHGNRGNLNKWGPEASQYVTYGYNVVVWDYRGYGQSTGKPTFDNILTDGKTVLEYIRHSEKNIIIFGRSLGSGIACKLSSEPGVSKIILETPYSSMKDVIRYHAGFLSSLTKNDIPSFTFIQKTYKPFLILHGDADEVIPLDSAKKLAGYIPKNNLRFVEIPSGEHNNLADFDIYHASLENFLHE